MDKFYKRINITSKVSAGLVLSGNIKDVVNTLQDLGYIFRDCRICAISLKEFAEAEKAINAVKACKSKVQLRRRQL